jgi:hypothetical protein
VRDAAGDEAYRLTADAGRWVWCDIEGQRGGDVIELVREIESCSFRDAVFALAGGSALVQRVRPAPAPVHPEPLVLPEGSAQAQREGRQYLYGRGIGAATVDAAEAAGMLRYAAGCVLFVGRDEAGQVRSATRRATDPSAKVQKSDLSGSSKSFCPILPGAADSVWIVEGGADALALQDLFRRGEKTHPTVLASGGAGVRSFLDQPRVQSILRNAARVYVAGENEKDADTQQRTDALHNEQARRVRAVNPSADVRQWHPPDGVKDLADLLRQRLSVAKPMAHMPASAHTQPEPAQAPAPAITPKPAARARRGMDFS